MNEFILGVVHARDNICLHKNRHFDYNFWIICGFLVRFGVCCLCHKVKTLNHILIRLLLALFLRQQIIILSSVIYICKMLCLQSDFFSVVRSMSMLWLLIKRIRVLVLLLLCNSNVAYVIVCLFSIRFG